MMCEARASSKEEIGLLRGRQIVPSTFEAMCRPIPLAAIYQYDSCYRYLKKPLEG